MSQFCCFVVDYLRNVLRLLLILTGCNTLPQRSASSQLIQNVHVRSYSVVCKQVRQHAQTDGLNQQTQCFKTNMIKTICKGTSISFFVHQFNDHTHQYYHTVVTKLVIVHQIVHIMHELQKKKRWLLDKATVLMLLLLNYMLNN